MLSDEFLIKIQRGEVNNLSVSDIAAVKWQYGMYGGFYSALFDAIARADESNLAKLALGFPNEVGGFLDWTRGDLAERLEAEAQTEKMLDADEFARKVGLTDGQMMRAEREDYETRNC